MSQMTITGQSTSWTMNVVGFESPIYGQINTSQTKSMAVHFPIKYAQPELQMDVQFRDEIEFQSFQRFVRNHQQQVSTNSLALVTFSWPQRSIFNFTGFIPKFVGGGARANYAPRARFFIKLVNSFVTQRTDIASVAANWNSIWGGFGSSGGVLAMPTAAEMQQTIVGQGQNPFDGGFLSPTGSPTGVNNAVLPEQVLGPRAPAPAPGIQVGG